MNWALCMATGGAHTPKTHGTFIRCSGLRQFFRVGTHSMQSIAQSRMANICTLCMFLMLLPSMATVHAAEPVSKSRFAGVAIGGHDSVAYHTLAREPQQNAVQGIKVYTVLHKGAKWHFAAKASADLFAADPERYQPAYNGHCANALSLGNGLVKTDGTHWEIFDKQLYLFYAGAGRERWKDGNWENYKAQADTAWAKLSQ